MQRPVPRTRCSVTLVALLGCAAGPSAPPEGAGARTPAAAAPDLQSPPRPMPAPKQDPSHTLVVDARWPVLAVPIGVARDGRRWLGAVDHDLVLFDDGRESARYPLLGAGIQRIASLPDGGWQAGARVLAPDGSLRFDGYAWGRRFGRFASASAMAVSPDGAVGIIAAADSPSKCLRDKGCGDAGGWSGALARLDLSRADRTTPPGERVLIEHQDRRDFVVAASNTAVAASADRTLTTWPGAGEGAPRTVELPAALRTLDFVGDRHLVGTRWVDTERGELVVLDGDAGLAVTATAAIEGSIRAISIHPTRPEVAVATSWYRARERVEIDLKRIEIYSLSGARLARIDVPDHPGGLAWSPAGDALFVAITSNEPSRREVIRYRVDGRSSTSHVE